MEKQLNTEKKIRVTNDRQFTIPPLVISRAKSAGIVGEEWIASLNRMISELETQWHICVGDALLGGTHAFVALADGENGAQYVLKLDMPEKLGGELSRGVSAMELADGNGYSKLYAYDAQKNACLLERLGKPINQLGYSVNEQLQIICAVLEKSWNTPSAENRGFPEGIDSVMWFREFIKSTWKELHQPCSQAVIRQAMNYLDARERDFQPETWVLIHGDAHGGNTLKELDGDGFKLIDPDGIFYEKAYDLGVLMREWVEEYRQNPLESGKERCRYLHELTGVPAQAIWEWGYLQTVSTAFVLLKIGQEPLGHKMLDVAECWVDEKTPPFQG